MSKKRVKVTVHLSLYVYEMLLKACEERGLEPDDYVETMLMWHARRGP